MASMAGPSQLARLEQAYRVLGVLPDSSALRIRSEYRRLARRSHPDTLPPDSPQQRHASVRMREINDAYELIKHAPLRFYVDAQPDVAQPDVAAPPVGSPPLERAPRESVTRTTPVSDTAEYGVRFVAGAVAGLVLDIKLVFLGAPLAVVVVLPLLTGGASALFGDDFWYWVLRFWWLWKP
jgi:hypothetical protein